MAPSKSGNKAPPPDFKRIKAKVGKRAPKPANLTDTSFKAASVSVRSQSVAPTTAAAHTVDLISSRGHGIHDLTAQLQHPAQPVRLSASKGLRDLILHSNAAALGNHLSLLLPAVAKCSVDSEDTVRDVGLLAMKDLFSLLGANASNSLTPFGPLLVATLSCALNSLDKNMRQHGAMLSQLVCRTVPGVVRPHVAEILPAFLRLLVDTKLFERKDDADSGQPATKKRKTTKQLTRDGDFSLANALLSLVSTVACEEQTWQGQFKSSKPDIVIAENSGSRNALMLTHPRHPQGRLLAIRELQDVSVWLDHTHSRAMGNKTSNILPKTVLDIMIWFRDVLIEVSQKRLSTMKDLETLLLLGKSIRRIWEFGRPVLDCCSDKERTELEKACRQIGKLTLEVFPLEAHGSSRALADELNSVLCAFLIALASANTQEKESALWRKRVASHVLASFAEIRQQETGLESNSAIYILHLFRELVLHHERQLVDRKARLKLAMAFCQAFFREEDIQRLIGPLRCRTGSFYSRLLVVSSPRI